MTIFYFTGTGNSLAVAKKIGNKNASLISIPQIMDSSTMHYSDDIIGIVFPVYFCSAPTMVREFLKKIKLEAKYFFAVATHGGMVGNSLKHVQKFGKIKFDYANDIRMVDNYLPLYEISKEAAADAKRNTAEKIIAIADDIDNCKLKKTRTKILGKILSGILGNKRIYNKYPQNYIVDDKCNKCGICAKVCLAKNIVVNKNVTFDNKCEACFACLHLCPQNALHHKKQKSLKRWLHADVSLNEIILSNNRITDEGLAE
ncbi:MAG: EFR1 family ferrodoxin [Firmicutes bacterium]|nr:EFR1 family ferrodoxin [Bacillota bacterium]